MTVLDNFPSMEELYESHRQEEEDYGVEPQPRDEYEMLPDGEYEDTYGDQFSYDLPLIIFTNPPTVPESIDYDTSDYHYSAGLGLGVHKKIGLVVVFHRDPRKNYIIPSVLFERYAQAVICNISLCREAIQLQITRDDLSLRLVPDCEIGEPGLEHTRGTLSPRCMPLQAMPIHFGFGCDCGIIRRKYGELSRHDCMHTDTIRAVAFQKFPQKKGRMAANFEVYCPTENGYAEARARDKSSSSQNLLLLLLLLLRTTTVPELQHHPLVKKVLQEVRREAVDTQVSGMKHATMVSKISQLLVGAMMLFSANINHVNLAGLEVVRALKGVANNTGGARNNNFNRRPSTYFRAVQTYATCVQYSKYMAELAYMVLMYGPKPASSIALTEMLDRYGDTDIVLEVNARDYHQMSGYSSHIISADERMRILNRTFTESSIRDIDQLVHWILNHCIKRDFDENLSMACDESQQSQQQQQNQQQQQQNQQQLQQWQRQRDSLGTDIEGDAIAAGILDDDGDDNGTPELYLEAMTRTMASLESLTTPAESLASLYYPVYGSNSNSNEEPEEDETPPNENAFVAYLGYLGAKYPTKQFCRSLSGICYVAKMCILLDIIKRARIRRVSLRDAEDPSIVDTGLYRILAQVRTHYMYLGLSLARSEGNLFRLNFSTGDIFNSDNEVVGHKNMISHIFGRLYVLARETIQGLSNGEELDYSVDNARLSDGMVSFTECVSVPLYSRYKHRLLAMHNNDIGEFRKAHSKLSLILITLLHILCLPARSTEIDRLTVEGTAKEYRGVYFLGPTFGFCYNYNKSANSKDPIIREIGPELSQLFLWYVLVFRRMYVELTRLENTTKLYQFDGMLADKLRWGVSYWFSYGMNNGRKYKFSEVRQILKRCIEFHYTKNVSADLDMYRLVYETIARTLGHSVATSTEHYGTIANYPPSVNAADVLRSRHLGQVWHRLGLRRKFVNFEGEVVEPEPIDVGDEAANEAANEDEPINEEEDRSNPVDADEDVDSVSDMLIEIPRMEFDRAVLAADTTPVYSSVHARSPSFFSVVPERSAVPEPPAVAELSIPELPAAAEPSAVPQPPAASEPNAPPVSVSWNDSTLSRNHPTSPPYARQFPGYIPPSSDAYLGAPLYDAHVSREVLLEARKRREKRERKERRAQKKRKREEKISRREESIRQREEEIRKKEEEIRKREENESRERKRAEEKREMQRAPALASPVTPVKTLKVKDVKLYRSDSPSGPWGPSGRPRAMPSVPPTPNLSARRGHPLDSIQSLALPGSSLDPRSRSVQSSHPSRVQKQPPSSRSLGSPLSPSSPQTPRRSLFSPQHLRQRITESLQASPLGRFFAPSREEDISDLELELDED